MERLNMPHWFRAALLPLILALLILSVPVPAGAQDTPDLARLYKEASKRKGKRPVIIIPGILGSELINKRTGEKVWFKIGRSSDDDVRLPINLNLEESRDDLVPGDIVRKLDIPLFKDIEIYQELIVALERYGGYTQGTWDENEQSLDDKYFLFPYDWRRDNVETARILFRKVEKLKRDSGNPDAVFNVIAHSMGGLITRYAAMYGDKDLTEGPYEPTWPGDMHFGKIFLFGTPNEGSADALQVLLEGWGAVKNINLPFVRDVTPVELLTMPAAFQLLPHAGTFHAYDEFLKPLNIDLYDAKTWIKYNWSFYGRKDIFKDFSEAEVGRMEQYLEVVLNRARNFHTALNADGEERGNVAYFIIGSDCRPTLDGVVIYRDEKNQRWVTLAEDDSFRRSDGVKVDDKAVEALIFQPGDGRVSRRSLLAETLAEDKRLSVLYDSALPLTHALFVCEEHDKLTGNKTIQNNLLTALVSEASLSSRVE
ncbi:MAG: hypothetical protein IPM63_06590 [Acidobacteriota bacterium]|nr:MAG: hypothetical protein IPM63_06590 [Acidobacteriota bacterium]